jgi:hypothetical protein
MFFWTSHWRVVRDSTPFRAAGRVRLGIAATAVLCLLGILAVLLTASARDVRSDPYYVAVYELIASLWLAGAWHAFGYFGISPRDDVMEKRNRAASWAVSGALTGVALCFAGSNVGNGPGTEAVIFCAAMASAALFLVWFVLDAAGACWADRVTIDRDYGSGVRLGSLLLAAGLSFGSAATGDWGSANGAVKEFLVSSWPIMPAICLGLAAERTLRRSPKPGPAWLAASAYMILTTTCVAVERRMR